MTVGNASELEKYYQTWSLNACLSGDEALQPDVNSLTSIAAPALLYRINQIACNQPHGEDAENCRE